MWPVELGREEDAPAFRMSSARRSPAFSLFSRFGSTDSSLVTPGRVPESTWSCRTHLRSVSVVPIPGLAATAFIADHSVS